MRGVHRVPEQIGAARIGLVQQGFHHPALGSREESAKRVVLTGDLVRGPDDAGVGAAAESQIPALEAEVVGDRRRRWPARDHHPLPAHPARRWPGWPAAAGGRRSPG